MRIEPKHLWDFAYDILIRCPRCSDCAHIRALHPDRRPPCDYRLTCNSCGHIKEWNLERDGSCPVPGAGPKLWEFDLWFQTPCCGESLWAYNIEHIEYLERLVGAKLRTKSPEAPTCCYEFRSLDSRLPKWMLASKNRRDVIKGIEKLKGMMH